MSLVRPLPPGTTHLLNHNGMAFLPPFVRARLNYLADLLDWHPDEEEYDEDEEATFTYYEVQGKLSDGHYTFTPSKKHVSPIHIWIAGDDNCQHSLYLGGSACWMCPDNHALFFDAIDPTHLPQPPEPNVWWCLHYEKDIKVVKILVCSAEDITEHFPDGV